MLSSLIRSRHTAAAAAGAAKGALAGRWTAAVPLAPVLRATQSKALSTDSKDSKSDLRVVHFKLSPQPHPLGVEKHWQNPIAHQVWSEEELAKVAITHEPTDKFHKKAAHAAIQSVRSLFDKVTDYDPKRMTIDKWLTRFIFLETVAGCPGMVAGMCRHLRSLRLMKRDYGWIHTLLEEAENERMHLLTFMHMKKPSAFFRLMVILTQGVFMNGFFIAYCLSPKFCHRFVGYLEEEAVKTYTHCLHDIDSGKIWAGAPAPVIAINYWKLKQDATMRDVIAAVRADEANHRDVNHTFAGLQREDVNPYLEKKH